MTVTITVPGRPVPKGRVRVTRYGSYTPASTVEYEGRVARAWRQSGGKQAPAGAPVEVTVLARFPIPSSLSKAKRADLEGAPHTKHRGDADNVAKSVLDALNGLAYQDDCAVYRLTSEKRYATVPYTQVTVAWEEP